jgi:hypothetical protein
MPYGVERDVVRDIAKWAGELYWMAEEARITYGSAFQAYKAGREEGCSFL